MTRRCHRSRCTTIIQWHGTLGFFGNLLASTTHYSSGPAPILFSSGYVTQKRWWTMNLILGFVYFNASGLV
ncbi:anion permease [Staphylococcus aureus]